MRRLDRFKAEFTSRLRTRGTDVWGYLLSTAWIMVFRKVFDVIVGKNPSFYIRLIVAVTFTAIATLVTMHTNVDDLIVHETFAEDENS